SANEPLGELLFVGPRVHRRMGEQRLDLRSEQKSATGSIVVEWAETDGVRCQEQPLPSGIEESECELPIQLLDKPFAEGCVGSQDDRRVGRRSVHKKRGQDL